MKGLLTYLLLFFSLAVAGNSSNNFSFDENKELPFLFNKFIAISSGNISPNDVKNFNMVYLNTINEFKEKKQKWNNDYRLLYHVFYKIHHSYLKEYQPVESFGLMLKEGKYGCLTGTVLYAMILDELHYDYEVVETNYHVYLVINTDKKQFLFESTDPIYGFYDSKKEIAKKLKNTSTDLKWRSDDSYELSIQINNRVGITELIGLQYYNMAVQSYNQGNLLQSITEINEAVNYYNSERLTAFLNLIMQEFNQQMQNEILEKENFANLHKIVNR